MGIKYFFKWFKESFPKTIKKCEKNQLKDENSPLLLLLDLNGIIHTSCQKIYKYGEFEPKSLLRKSPPIYSGEKDVKVFEDVLSSIEYLVNIFHPRELVLCIDGVAPVSKQIQQRQRRFMSKKTEGGFDSNCISPGTDFLFKLGIFLKSALRLKLEKKWLSITKIYFMDSLVPGEGEHKLFDFLRKHRVEIKRDRFNIIIAGNDGDLIMLALLVSALYLEDNSMYILREENLMICINRGPCIKKTDWTSLIANIADFARKKPGFAAGSLKHVICDFVILCFLVGNDFLPPSPLCNIYDGGLDIIMKYYFTNSTYLTFSCNAPQSSGEREPGGLNIDFAQFVNLFNHILNHVNPQAVQHYKIREYGYPNIMLDIAFKKEKLFINVTLHYLKAYSINHNITQKLVIAYLQEIDWVFNYYVYGSSSVDWKMYYPSQFAPSALDILNYLNSKKFKNSTLYRSLDPQRSDKIDPFLQLLCILPPHSSDLLPPPLNEVLINDLSDFHPKNIVLDYEGKINEWEGIPLLPPLNYKKIFSIYKTKVKFLNSQDLIRNTESNQLLISVQPTSSDRK